MIPGWFDWQMFYNDISVRFKSGTVVEVGTFLGRSLCYLGMRVKESGNPVRVVGVDWCRGSGVENGKDNHSHALQNGSFAGTLHGNVIACGLQDVIDILIAPSVRAASYFADRSLECVFLDARHDEDSLTQDIRAWLPKVRPGGLLCGDDVGTPDDRERVWPEVKVALDKLLPGWKYQPHDAWSYDVL